MLTKYKLPDGSGPPVKIEFGYDEPEYEVVGLTFRQKTRLRVDHLPSVGQEGI